MIFFIIRVLFLCRFLVKKFSFILIDLNESNVVINDLDYDSINICVSIIIVSLIICIETQRKTFEFFTVNPIPFLHGDTLHRLPCKNFYGDYISGEFNG